MLRCHARSSWPDTTAVNSLNKKVKVENLIKYRNNSNQFGLQNATFTFFVNVIGCQSCE